MIDVTDTWWTAVVIAAVAGLIGGLIYELLLSRLGDQGMAELLSKVTSPESGRRYVDLGFIASMLVGAVAAVGFLYFLQPTDTLDESSSVIARVYDPFRLIPGSVIVGSAGGAFLSAMQERAKRLIIETSNLSAEAALEQARASSGEEGDMEFAGVGGDRVRAASDAAIAILRAGRGAQRMG